MSIYLSELVFDSPTDDLKLVARKYVDDQLKAHGNAQYAELGVLLGATRALSLVHQQNHWCSKGSNYYGDHLLFMRLYEATDKEIDPLAEKAVGLGSESFVMMVNHMPHIQAFLELVADKLNNADEGYKSSNSAEVLFAAIMENIFRTLEQQGLLTPGLEQLIGTMMDVHEGHLYLLKQRLKGV
jgi:DNA-binding ferritin-like protein